MKKSINLFFFLSAFFMLTTEAISQKISDFDIKFGAYLESYIATDNDNIHSESGRIERQFTFANLYKNEFRLNIAQLSGAIDYMGIIRGNVTVHYGDFAYISHSGNPIQQAYVGYRLAENLWFDAGYFLTHIGGEAVLGKDNWLTAHSLVTFHEPFLHSGVKLTYEGKNFTAGFHILNGSIATFEDNNFNKTLGINLGYSFSDFLTATYAGVLGNEEPGSPNNAKLSMYHNICFYSELSSKFAMKGQFDYGIRDKDYIDGSEEKSAEFMGFSLQGRMQVIEQLFATVRFAYVDNTKKFNTYYTASGFGADLGIEFKPTGKSYIRLEGGLINFDDSDKSHGKVFTDKDGKPANSRMDARLTFGIWAD